MVLLDSITAYDQAHITCTAVSHLAHDNPLRVSGRLSVYAGIEYAAQAMAAHTRLLSAESPATAPRRGVLAVASKVKAYTHWLDDVAGPLTIKSAIVAQTSDSSLCRFSVSRNTQVLLQGQLTVTLTDA
jgi:predicted hotdog family 3-hydroxylacyl-ACP dehydratase